MVCAVSIPAWHASGGRDWAEAYTQVKSDLTSHTPGRSESLPSSRPGYAQPISRFRHPDEWPSRAHTLRLGSIAREVLC